MFSLVLLLFLDVGSFWSPPKLLCGLYALLLIEILVRVCYCSQKSPPIFHCLRSYCIKKNFVKNDQNFALIALGCAPWFPSLVSLFIFVAAPSGAMKLEQPISVRCHFDDKFKFSPNHRPEKWDDNTALYCRLSLQQNYRRIAILAKILRECHWKNREGLSNFREYLILHTELLKQRLLELSPPIWYHAAVSTKWFYWRKTALIDPV